MNLLTHEARIISGLDQIEDAYQAGPLAFDDPLYAYGLDKARDCNRLPARVVEDSFIKAVSTGDVEIAHFNEFTGLPLEPDEQSQPLAKRASSAFCSHPELGDLDPHFDQGRKILSVERRGKAKITKFEGGERWEIVEN